MRGGWLVWGCAWVAACGTGRLPGQIGRLERPVAESSGLVAAPGQAGRFWTHGDSGTLPTVFLVERSGRVVRRVTVTDPPNSPSVRDWEDVAADDRGRLWVADAGNNENRRRDLAVFAIAPGAGDAAGVDAVVRFRYPDQSGFPDPDRLDFDGEALFWDAGTLFLLTKHRSDTRTTLYRFPALQGEVVLEPLGSFDVGGDRARFGGMVTGADLASGGDTLAVLTYHAVFLFPRPLSGDRWLDGTPKVIALDQAVLDQCEAVAWDGGDLLIGNEDGRLFRIPDVRTWSGRFPAG